jgi:hypothetical protein
MDRVRVFLVDFSFIQRENEKNAEQEEAKRKTFSSDEIFLCFIVPQTIESIHGHAHHDEGNTRPEREKKLSVWTLFSFALVKNSLSLSLIVHFHISAAR